MLALLSLLQTPRDWPGAQLAERLGVSPRTVRRDVDRLRELGYRIGAIKGPDGGYRLAAGSELPPLLFDDEQAVAIAVALQSAPASGVDLTDAAARALATVRQVMPSRLRHRIDGIRFTSAPGSAGTGAEGAVEPEVLDAVSAAVRDRRTLRFDYAGAAGDSASRPDDTAPRRTEPHAIVARDGRWYLLAWDQEREDWRIFRLDRVTPRIPTGPVFERRPLPMGDAATYLAASFRGSERSVGWPCVGTVELTLPPGRVAPWMGDGEVMPIGEDACRLTIGSWSWMGVLAQAARFDAPFAVIGPDPLRDAAATLAERLAAGGR